MCAACFCEPDNGDQFVVDLMAPDMPDHPDRERLFESEKREQAAGGSGSGSELLPLVVDFGCPGEDESSGLPRPHIMCLDCFKNYATMCVSERNLILDKVHHYYTIACPHGCPGACMDPATFCMLGPDLCTKYTRFFALNFTESRR